MTTFNKILKPVYSAIANYATSDDGAINAKYVLGFGEDNEGEIIDFVPMISEYKYIDPEAAKMLTEKPLTEEDIGKTPNEIMLVRIYQHLKATEQIVA
ncbi:hypothetical protein P9074_11580 [Gallibacterium anatis]|uniref:hypothetical protein n=1 Tax=Gallibacterium anatis TaxID=750 RepID=UPI003005DA74